MSREYVNGQSDDRSARYGGSPYDRNESPGLRGNRERRAGGYGGFFEPENGTSPVPSARPTPPPEPPLEPRAGNWRRRPDRGDRDWSDQSRSRERSRANGARRYADGPGSRQIEDVLQYIQQDWTFMTEEQCVPVQVALQLMDTSSLGRAHQYDQFQQTHKQLQRALKAIVNEHHQGFNSSIGTFHKIQSSIHVSQNRVRSLKDELVQAKTSLLTTKPELKDLATSSQGYDEMLQVLGQIEQLQLVPEKLEARISDKRFLTAVDTLQQGLRLIRKPEMENIGALGDLKVYLSNQEMSLTDILIEELHSHLYLKSPYCQERWKPFSAEQGSYAEGDNSDVPIVLMSGKPLYRFLETLDVSIPMIEDASKNPEADSFYYLQLLIESLNKMGHLDVAVDSIEQRLPLELFRVVEKTNNEVDQRHPSTLRSKYKNEGNPLFFGLRDDDMQAATVYDLLWTLYSKFEAIAEGHRVLHDVIAGIVKREGLRNSRILTRGFKELWKLYQSEIRSLLHDYLATDGDLGSRGAQAKSGAAGLGIKAQRDRSKRMFKLSAIDSKSIEISAEQDDLESILKSSVPGLVSESRRPAGMALNDGAQQPDGSATGHKLLIEPTVFNMSLLLPPSLSFIQRLKAIVPQGSDIVMSTLTSFLDDFLVNVFHPQLDETLVELSSRTFIELDAFQEDPQWSNVARKPIFKGTSAFYQLIIQFCKMLGTIPHDQAFSQLIITQMVTYYEQCYGWYKSLITRAHSRAEGGVVLKAAAGLAGSGEIPDTIIRLWTAEAGEHEQLVEQETGLLILNTNETPLEAADIISDRKTITSLCMLYTSMKWLATKIRELRHVTSHQVDSSRQEGKSRPGRRWTLLGSAGIAHGASEVHLPMTQETLVAFDGVVTSFEELAANVLLNLHVEIRCHAILHLNTMLHGTYTLEHAVNDPDPSVLALNDDLVSFDEDISTHLGEQQRRFLTTGLAHLLATLVVANTPLHVRSMNHAGADRMLLNILALQQNLQPLEPDTSLARAAAYLDLFKAGPEAVIERARSDAAANGGGEGNGKTGFGYDELKALIELCFSEPLGSERREVAMQAKRGMGDALLRLSEVMWQS
ncbi:MAG: hypothetical protein M1833_000058 [Piccolia ochrophora]|nr:MAG: hypothetical protein M1833_000058 [Piccolia ochrophora]